MFTQAQTTAHRDIRSFALAGLLATTMAACSPGDAGGGGKAALNIDGESGAWTIRPGTEETEADARFNRHGVATAVMLRARDGGRYVELHSTFLGEPSEPVFLHQKLSYRDDTGILFERVGPRAADDDDSGIGWQRLELDVEGRTGYAAVTLDVPVCVDHYTGPLEYETRCHQVTGTMESPLVHAPQLRMNP